VEYTSTFLYTRGGLWALYDAPPFVCDKKVNFQINMHVEYQKCIHNFSRKTWSKKLLGRSRHRWKDNIKTKIDIVTCHLRSQPIQRFVAGQQFRNTQEVLEKLQAAAPRVTMEVHLEEVFSLWSVPRSYLEDTWGDPVSYQLWDIVEWQSRLQPSRVSDVNCE
jgi:hypothetical protein